MDDIERGRCYSLQEYFIKHTIACTTDVADTEFNRDLLRLLIIYMPNASLVSIQHAYKNIIGAMRKKPPTVTIGELIGFFPEENKNG